MSALGPLFVIPKLCVCYIYDAWRFARAAHLAGNPLKNRATARAHLLRLSHSFEKGMALPVPKPGFGQEKARLLLCDLNHYLNRYGADEISGLALDILHAAFAYHRRHGIEWPQLVSVAAELQTRQRSCTTAVHQPVGIERVTRKQILAAAPQDPDAYFALRRSVRQFSPDPISNQEIERAVRLAQRSPSVCNRQGVKVYTYTDPVERSRVLGFQDGNRGFGDHGSVVFVITSDLSIFYKNGERNQGFVDGGLFAMSLALALHAIGLGSCMLNWSMGAGKDAEMRRALGIPDSEVVVMLMVGGRLLPEFSVAASPRRPIEDVLIWADAHRAK